MAAPKTNLMLEAMQPASRELLLASAKEVVLPPRASLQDQDETPNHVYFMLSGVASVVVALPKGGAVEVALVGREGMVGSFAVMGPAVAPTVCFMQLAGSAYQIRFPELRKIFLECADVRQRVLEYAQVQALTTNQVAACNKLHGAESRLARWLLMVRDRIKDDHVPLTQEFLAEMLGTRRTTVALAAGALQDAGLIEYRRGKVNIISPTELEGAACECYPITRRFLDGLYKD